MTQPSSLMRIQDATAIGALADVLIDITLERPVEDTLAPARVLPLLEMLATGWDDVRLQAFATAEHERLGAAYGAQDAHLRTQLPAAWVAAANDAVTPPVTLDPALVLRLLDQPQVRRILADLLRTQLTDFVRRMSTPLNESRLVSGVMNRAKGLVQGGITGGILAAVGGGLEAEAERRVRDFVDEAVGRALQQLVAQTCDPKFALAYGQLRAGILQSALDAPTRAWVQQVAALDPVGATMGMVRAIRDSVATPAFAQWLEQQWPHALGAQGHTVGQVLEDAGVLTAVRTAAHAWLSQELAHVLAHPHLARWWAVHAEGQPPGDEGPPPSKPQAPRKSRGGKRQH